MSTTVSVFKSAGTSQQEYVAWPVDVIPSIVREGRFGLDLATQEARAALSRGDKKQYDRIKARSFMAPTFSGRFLPQRRMDNLVEHSGLIGLDYDHIDDVDGLMELLAGVSSTYFAFRSPSGAGIKVFVPVEPKPLSNRENHYAWARVNAVYRVVTGLDSDRACKDVTRLCFLAHDARAHVNANAVPVEWTVPPPAPPSTSIVNRDASPEIQALQMIPRSVYDVSGTYEEYRSVIFAAHAARIPEDVVRQWDSRGTSESRRVDFEKMWRSLNANPATRVSAGTLFYLARKYAG